MNSLITALARALEMRPSHAVVEHDGEIRGDGIEGFIELLNRNNVFDIRMLLLTK